MRVIVYTGASCGPCIATKHGLKARGIAFEELNAHDHVDKITALQAKHSLTRDLPVVVAGDDVWAGFQPSRIGDLAARIMTVDGMALNM